MKGIRIQNLRCIRDTGNIDLKGINVLLGQNSSGKSTFLRSFPLLSQSLQVETRGPILWYGNYVDFGTFSDSVRSKQGEMFFTFKFEIPLEEMEPRHYRKPFSGKRDRPVEFEIQIRLVGVQKKENAVLEDVRIRFEGQEINIYLDQSENGSNSKITVNDSTFSPDEYKFRISTGFKFLPQIRGKQRTKIANQYYVSKPEQAVFVKLKMLLDKHLHHKSSEDRAYEGLRKLRIGSDEEILHKLKQSINQNTWKENTNGWQIDTSEFIEIRDCFLFTQVAFILNGLERRLVEYYGSSVYIAPLRARAERYYRVQNLAVEKVDPQGDNLPMFIRSLSDRNRLAFNEWTLENFDFQVKIGNSAGHLSLRLIDHPNTGKENEVNLADTGFGYSQIMPLITQLWWSIYGIQSGKITRRGGTASVIAIEQPELHLHPSLQALLADVFFKVAMQAKEKGYQLHLILETHSETMVNRFGRLISEYYLDQENIPRDEFGESVFCENDLQVILFEKAKDSTSKVSLATFNRQGELENWPYGFFEPDY